MTNAAEAFATELATYREHLPRLLAYEGSHVVVKGDQVYGPFGTYLEALEFGCGQFGLDPFMVKLIERTETIHRVLA